MTTTQLKKNIEKRMMYVGVSDIKGVGLRAMHDIEKHTVIHYFHPEIIAFELKYLKTIATKDQIIDLKKKYYYDEKNIYLDPKLTNDLIYYLNHSEDSNIRYQEGYYISTRKIYNNEEIVLNWAENNYHPKLRDFENEEL